MPLRDYFASPIHDFIEICSVKHVTRGYYPFIKAESYKNLTNSVSQHAAIRGLPPYIKAKLVDDARKLLDKLFNEKLVELTEVCSLEEIETHRAFFVSHEKDLKEEENLQRDKQNIPEDPDIKLIICSCKMGWTSPYLLSNDAHFVGYLQEIHQGFNIRIIPMTDVRQYLIEWGWTR